MTTLWITMGTTYQNTVQYQLNPGSILQAPKTDSLVLSVRSPLIIYANTEILGTVNAWERGQLRLAKQRVKN